MAMVKEREQIQTQLQRQVRSAPSRQWERWNKPSANNSNNRSHSQKTLLQPSTQTSKPAYKRSYQDFVLTKAHDYQKASRFSGTFSSTSRPFPYPIFDIGQFILPATLKPAIGLRKQERLLLAERSDLLNYEFAETLSDAQAARLHQVETLLDRIEDQDPVEREADRRLAQTGDKLDEILALLRSLPRRTSEDTL